MSCITLAPFACLKFGLFGLFFQPEQCFSLTTIQPEQCFSASFSQSSDQRTGPGKLQRVVLHLLNKSKSRSELQLAAQQGVTYSRLRTKGPVARANSGRPANRERADSSSGRLRSRSRALASREAQASGRQIWQAQQQGRDTQALAQVRNSNRRDLRRHMSSGGHGRRQNEKRRMGTYWLEELRGAREDGRWSSPTDEVPDWSPLDVGDEER